MKFILGCFFFGYFVARGNYGLAALMVVVTFLTACGPKTTKDYYVAQPQPVSATPATPDQCPAGGTVLTVGDQTLLVCNGLDGQVAVVDDPDDDKDHGKKGDDHGKKDKHK